MIVVVGKHRDMDQPFNEEFAELHEKAELYHTGDNAVVHLTELVLHELELEHSDYVPFSFHGGALATRAVSGGIRQGLGEAPDIGFVLELAFYVRFQNP